MNVHRLALAALALSVAAPACSYPTSLNVIPSADVLDPGIVRIELESDGAHTPFTGDADAYLFTQYGFTSRFEAGVDLVNLGTGPSAQLNAKWQFLPEGRDVPAAAVGVLDLAHSGLFSGWYVTLAKDAGPVRLHAGCVVDDSPRAVLGAEYCPTDHTELLADWTTGPKAYHSAGVGQDLGHGLWLWAYYARDNTRGAGDFAGLNLSWETSLRRRSATERK